MIWDCGYVELTNGEKKLIKFLKGKGYVDSEDIFKNIERNEASSSISWLKEKKLVNVSEHPVKYYVIGPEGKKVLEKGLPEENLLKYYNQGINVLSELEKVMGDELRYGLAQILKSGGKVVDGKIVIDDDSKLSKSIVKIKDVLSRAKDGQIDENDAEIVKSRKGFLNEKVRMVRSIRLTDEAERISDDELIETNEINQITPDVIDKFNDEIKLRPYDVNMYAPRYLPGKIHPLSEFVTQVREVMLQMGFSELRGEIVESAFWDMDILFIPQNHPAREMQDTFYVKGEAKLDRNMVNKIRDVHERGISGSKGWQYDWSEKEASKMLLRTHTTVNTIRYLVEHPNEKCKIFSVEKIFRRENVDSRHLAEFTQVEGVIAGEGVTFGTLMKTLKEFYNRIGITEIWFKPSYFPYTEPSLEIHGKFMGKEMELGGAGMFRPEVLKPWGIKYNVAAWGLGLERLLMLVLNLEDIRDIYRNDLSFLRERKILKNIF
ncbi:MAG: phenylalanine--tRNA ligase subunit alpha [Thermoplasmata archaeon]